MAKPVTASRGLTADVLGVGRFVERVLGDAGIVYVAHGHWLVENAAALDLELKGLGAPKTKAAGAVLIDLADIDALDTAGAWLLLRTSRTLNATLENVPKEFAPLLVQVEKGVPENPMPLSRRHLTFGHMLASVGEKTIGMLGAGRDLLGFFGLVLVTSFATLFHPSRFRLTALIAQMQNTGLAALPIIGLLNFLIGVVIAYQGADQLKQFGAEIFTVNLLGITVLRELGVLITAIIVAGRSGSAFTAEIGAMRVNEEVDALQTLGLDPVQVLVMPRMFGLIITLPLLTFYANVMALAGGAVMCFFALGIYPSQFLAQLQSSLAVLTFWLGVIKAPFFAVIIALVGCHAGFSVERSAESVGRFTTLSVVRSIFLVIVLDAGFSILFADLDV